MGVWLRRRLHAAIVRARLQEAVEERARGYGEPRTLSGIIRALFKPLLMTFQTVIINLKLLPVPGRTCKVLISSKSHLERLSSRPAPYFNPHMLHTRITHTLTHSDSHRQTHTPRASRLARAGRARARAAAGELERRRGRRRRGASRGHDEGALYYKGTYTEFFVSRPFVAMAPFDSPAASRQSAHGASPSALPSAAAS